MEVLAMSALEALRVHVPRDGGAEVPESELAGVVVVRVRGEVDLYTGPALRSTLHGLLAPPGADHLRVGGALVEGAGGGRGRPGANGVRAVVVDLTDVDFIDSFALGVLIQGHRWARPGGRAYAVVAVHEMIQTLFRVTGLAKVLPLHPDVLTAVRRLRPANSDVST